MVVQQPVQLDRQAFTEVVQVPALRVPKQKCQQMMQRFRGYALDRPRLRAMVDDGERKDTKLLLLDSKGVVAGAATATELQPALAALVEAEGLEVLLHSYTRDYSALTAEQVLRKLIPAHIDVPVSFETIGHIAHLNLRDEQLPYKEVIGQVLLDKNAHIRTVVNKLGSIDNEFRVFAMEVIAGEACTETEVVQHGMRFKLDFAQVYWNSRLEAEHERLVRTFQRSDVIADVMAGIGPFAVPAAQKGCTVYANDLNPSSVRYLAINARSNRVSASTHIFNMDGRAFVRLLCGDASAAPAPVPAAAEPTPVPPSASAPASAPAPVLPAAESAGSDAQIPAQAQELQAPAAARPSEAVESAVLLELTSPTGAAAPLDQPPSTSAAAPDAQPPQPSQRSSSAGRNRSKSKHGAAEDHSNLPFHEPSPAHPIPPTFRPGPPGVLFQHAVMNLPASGIEFLDAFRGAFDPATWRGRLPMVHCYTFMKAPEVEADILAKAERYLGGTLDPPPTIHTVRDVAPNKLMLCLSFRVPEAVAFHGRRVSSSVAVGAAELRNEPAAVDVTGSGDALANAPSCNSRHQGIDGHAAENGHTLAAAGQTSDMVVDGHATGSTPGTGTQQAGAGPATIVALDDVGGDVSKRRKVGHNSTAPC